MRQVKPLSAQLKLADTLSRRVSELRTIRKYSLAELARMTRFAVRRLEDIEAGMETWLSATDRQVLAKALGVEPEILQAVEVRPDAAPDYTAPVIRRELAAAILAGASELNCPECGQTLRCSIQEGLDLDGNEIRFAKAFCPQCPFVLRA